MREIFGDEASRPRIMIIALILLSLVYSILFFRSQQSITDKYSRTIDPVEQMETLYFGLNGDSV